MKGFFTVECQFFEDTLLRIKNKIYMKKVCLGFLAATKHCWNVLKSDYSRYNSINGGGVVDETFYLKF